jgi:Rod binding domain-containing protein
MGSPVIQSPTLLPLRSPAARVLPLPGQGAGTSLSPQQVAKAQQAARDFEAVAIGEFLAPMFNTVDVSKNPFGGGTGEQQWRPMLTEELAKQIAKAGGLGIADTVLQQMLRTQEQRGQK